MDSEPVTEYYGFTINDLKVIIPCKSAFVSKNKYNGSRSVAGIGVEVRWDNIANVYVFHSASEAMSWLNV